jgi:hypothetical protein
MFCPLLRPNTLQLQGKGSAISKNSKRKETIKKKNLGQAVKQS